MTPQSANTSRKISKKELSNILCISYPTALKEYQKIIDCLNLKRTFLTIKDLETYGII